MHLLGILATCFLILSHSRRETDNKVKIILGDETHYRVDNVSAVYIHLLSYVRSFQQDIIFVFNE